MSQIKVTLHSDLCAGSGQSLGNRVDTDICTDSYGIPYIPARRIKGCLREASEELSDLGLFCATQKSIEKLFGGKHGEEGGFQISDARLPGIGELQGYIERVKHEGTDLEKRATHPNSIAQMYSYRRGQTRLADGVKVDGSLRFINVLKHYDPIDKNHGKEIEFFADVEGDFSDNLKELLNACCKAVRHIGLNRNRGLGNVSLEFISDNNNSVQKITVDGLDPEKNYLLQYKIVNVSALTLPDCDETRTSIPSKSVIGILAGRYLTGHAKDATFDKLFLDGSVIWSDLNPIVNGQMSYPVPMFVAKLKNYNGKLVNRFADNGELDWKSLKPKTMDTGYMSEDKKDFFISDLPLRSIYHNSVRSKKLNGDGLYVQDSIDSGYVYGGTVRAQGKYIGVIADLLQQGTLRFGRSRSAQYATCHLIDISMKELVETEHKSANVGEPILVCLKSDMLLYNDSGAPISTTDDVRKSIAVALDLSDEIPEHYYDLVRFNTTGGYQRMWQLQKPHVQVVSAGSVFCFTAKKGAYPIEAQIGRNKQEGNGICRIFSHAELQAIKNINKGRIDRATDSFEESGTYQKQFRSAVIANACMEQVADNAESISKHIADLKGKKAEGNKKRKGIPTGRMRLMAFEAIDYADLRKKVDEIKESDIDSASIGRRWECHELLDMLFGSDRKKISCRAMLGIGKDVDEEAFGIDKDVQSMLEMSWKKPLDIVLHSLHYSGGGE